MYKKVTTYHLMLNNIYSMEIKIITFVSATSTREHFYDETWEILSIFSLQLVEIAARS